MLKQFVMHVSENNEYILNTWKRATLKKVYGLAANQQPGELYKSLID
jgi:hypothetical protein